VPDELQQAAGGGVPVYPVTTPVEQDRAAHPSCDGAVDGPADCRRQRDQDDLAALVAQAKDPVAVLLAQVADVSAGGFAEVREHNAAVDEPGRFMRRQRPPCGMSARRRTLNSRCWTLKSAERPRMAQ